jgi:tetratricopeptide (TPR) repeat protein
LRERELVAESERIRAQRVAYEEAQQREKAEEKNRVEAERVARIEAERLLAERAAAERAEKEAAERLAKAEEKRRVEAERAARIEQQRPVSAVSGSARQDPGVVPVFINRAQVLGPAIQVAAVKLERLIEIPAFFDGSQSSPSRPLGQLPVGPSFMIDVDRLVKRQQEIRRLDSLIAANPANASAHYQRANLSYSISDLDGAAQGYSRVLELQPDYAAAFVNRGAIRRKMGDLSGALRDYDSAIALAPRDPDAYRNRGIARELVGDLSGALSDWDRAASLGDQDSRQWLLAAAPKPVDLNIESLTHMHSAARVAPTLVSALSRPAAPDPKVNKLTVALMSKPQDAALLLQRGTAFLKSGRFDKAVADFTAALGVNPAAVKAIFNRAVARRQLGDLNGALTDYDRVIQLSPKDGDAYRNRGIVKQQLGSLSGACADWGVAQALGDVEVKTWIRDECR